ncbi:hypothetical protein BofuT4_P053810.1 [Botrytis cinerea T4]|uniref:Uncharacterized protein n=1 Tax=Botryotinia fuckeliana (strain T4) TaxID=999810 RepID=G2XVG0_BOTF4|nr:hypothetical protein BofuT4_P053810.1 [Botrytis cinerea T4]
MAKLGACQVVSLECHFTLPTTCTVEPGHAQHTNRNMKLFATSSLHHFITSSLPNFPRIPKNSQEFPPACDEQQASRSWHIPTPWAWEAPLFNTHSSTYDFPASESFASSNPWRLIGNISMPQYAP